MILLFVAIAAGLLGLLPHAAPEGAEYLPRLRLMLLGASGLGCAGIAWFVWRKARGWRRWLFLTIAVLAARITYAPAVAAALVVATWVERAAVAFDAERTSLPVHYVFGCFVGAFTALAALLAVASALYVKRPKWAFVLVLYLALGVLAFSHPADRTVSPHPLGGTAPKTTRDAPPYADVVGGAGVPVRARVVAAAAWLRDRAMPGSPWSWSVREHLAAAFEEDPPLRDRLAALEAAALRARPLLTRTSPDTRPGS